MDRQQTFKMKPKPLAQITYEAYVESSGYPKLFTAFKDVAMPYRYRWGKVGRAAIACYKRQQRAKK